MTKRGQAAIEFLMTYGWAILAVIITIGALAYFGVIGSSNLSSRKCVLGPGLSCTEFKVDNLDGNSLTIKVKNSFGTNLNSIVFTVREVGQTTNCVDVGPLNPASILDGAEATFLWNCPGVAAATPENTKFQTQTMTFTYIKGSETLSHRIEGYITTVVE